MIRRLTKPFIRQNKENLSQQLGVRKAFYIYCDADAAPILQFTRQTTRKDVQQVGRSESKKSRNGQRERKPTDLICDEISGTEQMSQNRYRASEQIFLK